MLKRFADDAHVVIGTTQHNSAVVGVGEIRHGGSGMTHIGGVTGGSARLQPIRTYLPPAGWRRTAWRTSKLIWQKMFTNVSASVLTGVLQVPMGYIAAEPERVGGVRNADSRGGCRRGGRGLDFDADENRRSA